MPKKSKATVAELEAKIELLTLRVSQLEMRVLDSGVDATHDPAVPSEPLDAHTLWRDVVGDMRHYDETTGWSHSTRYDLRGYL